MVAEVEETHPGRRSTRPAGGGFPDVEAADWELEAEGVELGWRRQTELG